VRSDTNLGTKKRRGSLLLKTHAYLPIRQLTQRDTPYLPVALGLCRTANMVFREIRGLFIKRLVRCIMRRTPTAGIKLKLSVR